MDSAETKGRTGLIQEVPYQQEEKQIFRSVMTLPF